MKISIVTISYNQSEFIDECIKSVLDQKYPHLQYIIVDAGSSDGSREIINSYGSQIVKVFEPDLGPADGLNKGFSIADGDIYYFLNSDDLLEPHALNYVANYFKENPNIDIVSGNSYIINDYGLIKRKFFSDTYRKNLALYNACIISQASTFFRSKVFISSDGFNINNKLTWDGEFFLDVAILGFKFKKVNKFFSKFRVHSCSVTGSKIPLIFYEDSFNKIFFKIKGYKPSYFNILIFYYFRYLRKILNPLDTIQRIFYGPIS
jgi:glycosyltransferase involved in cell wall biosynthesis